MKVNLPPRTRQVLRAAVALGLLVWLANRIGLATILDQFARTHVGLVLAATALLAVDGVTKAWNWQQMLEANVDNQSLPFRRVLAWFFAGGLIGAIVPSSASTDACRVVLATRGVGGYGPACMASVITLNALGWFTGCVIGTVALGILATQYTLPAVLYSLALVFLVTLAALSVSYVVLSLKRASMMVIIDRAGRRWPRIRITLAGFLDALLVFQRARVRFPVFVLVAAGGLLAQGGMFAVTAHAVGIDLPFAVWMMLVPLTRIVALVPVSIADFGLIQAAHVSFLSLFGVLPWEAFALSTLFAIEGLLIHSTLGGSAFLLNGRRMRPAVPQV